jgi:hypothetical protein
MGDRVIDIFTSPNGKRIIAIDEDSGISAIHAVGRIMLIGTDEAISQLRIALNSERDGWTKEAIDACKIRLPKLTSEQKAEILKLSAEGLISSEIATMLDINGKQVHGVIQANRYPILDNIAKKVARETAPMSDVDRIDKIIADGRKAGHGFLRIADDINRIVGGHWLPNDVHKRIMEAEG